MNRNYAVSLDDAYDSFEPDAERLVECFVLYFPMVEEVWYAPVNEEVRKIFGERVVPLYTIQSNEISKN